MLVVFNPISGVGIGDRGGIIPLGYQLTQTLLMQHTDEQYLKVGIKRGFSIYLHRNGWFSSRLSVVVHNYA